MTASRIQAWYQKTPNFGPIQQFAMDNLNFIHVTCILGSEFFGNHNALVYSAILRHLF
jgi:hypothetical protein